MLNIATCEYLRGEYPQSLKFFDHALTVVHKNKSGLFMESKVLVQMANVLVSQGNIKSAHGQLSRAVQNLMRLPGHNSESASLQADAQP